MRVDVVSYINSNSVVRNYPSNKAVNSIGINFKGEPDSFQKQEYSPEDIEADKEIKFFDSACCSSNKQIRKYENAYFNNLKKILKSGAKKDYKQMVSYTTLSDGFKFKTKRVTFSDVNEDSKVPQFANIWEDGNLKGVYEIFSTKPSLFYAITSYIDNGMIKCKCIDNRCIRYTFKNNNGLTFEQYPLKKGFLCCQIEDKPDGTKKFKNVLYHNNENPEQSYYTRYNDGIAYVYRYDEKEDFWLLEQIKSGSCPKS